jgi:hypothetical protein
MNTITEKRSQEKNDAKEDASASTKVTSVIIGVAGFSSTR